MIGVVWTAVAGALLPPTLLALALGESWQPFAFSIVVALSGGLLLLVLLRGVDRALDHRSAFLAVSLTWVSVCALGSLPYLSYPVAGLPLADAFFEATSGFTATGSTVISGLDAMPRSLLLWRSTTQWLGGMGMVLFGIAILPLLGVGGMQLYKAEAPGVTKEKFTPRIAETAKILWILYLGLTVVAATLYGLGGMSLFDAVCHAMTTISTAGYSTHDRSLGYFDSGYIHVVATLLMLTGGTSFAILHRALTSGISWSDQPELRTYIGIFAVATTVIAFDLMLERPERVGTLATALEHAAFQSASILTTTKTGLVLMILKPVI